jgi:hypothetical protein
MPDSAPAPELIRVAVDPGQSGGIVWNESGRVHAIRMPATDFSVVEHLVAISKKSALVEIYIEEPPLFAGKHIPGSSVGKMMWNTGIIYGAAVALQFKVHRVRPQAWQKTHPVGTKGDLSTTQWKNKLKARAAELFPDHHVTLATADALLLYNAAARNAIN